MLIVFPTSIVNTAEWLVFMKVILHKLCLYLDEGV